jgi:hypothetical protein
MDRNVPDLTPMNDSDVTGATRGAGSGPEAAPDVVRKPYTRPRLIEHGRLAKLTFDISPTDQSDRNAKEAFESVDPCAVLAAVAALPIERWSYKGETVRHLGPMAQGFAAAFGLGADDRHIFPLDAAGVALAAIQGLHGLLQTQTARLEALERELTALRRETAALRIELAVREGAFVA